jgi:hypothetical protein
VPKPPLSAYRSRAVLARPAPRPPIIAAPTSVLDSAATNAAIQGFNEVINFTTTVNHATDTGIIAAGTRVDSHMIFLNSENGAFIEHDIVVFTFSGEILGVMSDVNGTLEGASTFELGASGTSYEIFSNRGLENNDGYVVDGLKRIVVSMRVREPGDWIRVVTAATPLPAAFWLFITALVSLVSVGRIRRWKHKIA